MIIWNSTLVLLLWGLMTAPLADSRKYMRCELTRELLLKYQINKTFISNWICMIEHESGGDTNKIATQMNGSSKFGLFQIDDKEYCRNDRKGGVCQKNCKDFLNDNIEDDVECAKMIFEREGFKHWRGWQQFCRNKQNLPNLSLSCNIHTLPSLSALNTYNGGLRFTSQSLAMRRFKRSTKTNNTFIDNLNKRTETMNKF